MAGYPVRIILGMMIILPFLSKLAVKGSHLIFGKPKNSLLDEGKEPEQVKNNNQTQIPQQLQPQPVQQTTTTQTTTSKQEQSSSNLLDRYKNNNTTTTVQTVKQQNNPQEPVRTYIPSPVGVQIVNQREDTSSADQAMMRADNAAKLAMQTLKMN